MRNDDCFRREKGHATVLVVGGASEALNYDSEEIKYTLIWQCSLTYISMGLRA